MVFPQKASAVPATLPLAVELRSLDVGETLAAMRAIVPDALVAVSFDAVAEFPARVGVDPLLQPLPDDGYSLELRLASWLLAVDTPVVCVVPTYLNSWLSVERALVLPIVYDGVHRGALIVEVGRLSRGRVRALEELRDSLAREIESLELQWHSSIPASSGAQSASLWRIRTSR